MKYKTKDKTAEGTSRNERKTTSRRRERPKGVLYLLVSSLMISRLRYPSHVVNKLGNLLVFETEKLKKLKKYIHVPGMWRMWRMRERSSGTCPVCMACICTLANKRTSEQDRSFSYREVGGRRYIYTLAWEVEVGAVCKGIM